ncbi:Glycosyl transferase, group 1 [Candidatus Methylomirabilis lanthanidiphila]|uniref:Glycosyl transferase, group 1 n=1 Tax=Candidatus Methylomirabilis lanthanidiphila TaxID=2211376 RepID=A0A564ZHM9_9BACT|nr:glycosyltransferase family 4 protein [Candidatus Methylomirabilis lanthanidiphila]VUZ84850.1 Glycosyl transferase, group 1 [Candidatus Methylomirabilis lanthanidiphila]
MKPLAYIVGTFPTITETFILGEMQALCVQGVTLHLFALRRPIEIAQYAPKTDFGAMMHYGPAFLDRHLWGANLRMLRAYPGRYLKIVGGLLARTAVNPIHCLKALGVFPIAVAFAEVVAESGIEHIHAHWATHPATVAYIISRLLKIPFSFTAHAYDATLIRTMMREKVRRAAFIITCTRLNRRLLTALFPESESKILVNHHGIFLDRFIPNGKQIVQPQAEFRILSCGSLYPRKGFPDLVEACRLLRDKGWKFRCEIIGEGPLRRRLERSIALHHLEEVVSLRGALPQKEVIDSYRAADLFVLSCTTDHLGWDELFSDPLLLLEVGLAAPFRPVTDGIPNVLVEAMAMGIPVVSTNAGAVPELIQDGRTGTLVPERDPRALAAAIDHLLTNPHTRQELAREARETVRRYFDRSKNVGALLTTFTSRLQTNGNRISRCD